MSDDIAFYQTLSDIINVMNEISIKEDRMCVPLSKIRQETNLSPRELRRIINEAKKMGKIFGCQDLGIKERGYTVIKQERNVITERKDMITPVEVTRDYVVVEYKTITKTINLSLDYVNYINVNFYGDIVWGRDFYYSDSTGNEIRMVLNRDVCPHNSCSFTFPTLKPVLPRHSYSFTYITYYYLYPETDYFVFDFYAPTIKFSAKIYTDPIHVIDVQYKGIKDPKSSIVYKSSKDRFEIKGKVISPPLRIITKLNIKTLK
ncbi:hypothetical protein [Stygiolobus caldivivus]|uniref:Uncharacterized protein n=1 Tax=Stygiolobus caldivivus TaxID=2824673 RepID=A0A8D5U5E0_9CREN|nr:hypothetical protein [Stygiolobus caldivivus]BCU69618.1 hypothetical protein KN1_09150 [Stygiolobus caldivivus]